jgi:hypothetical protein
MVFEERRTRALVVVEYDRTLSEVGGVEAEEIREVLWDYEGERRERIDKIRRRTRYARFLARDRMDGALLLPNRQPRPERRR